MDQKRSSLGLKRSPKNSKTAEKGKLFSAFNSPVGNKSTSLYKSVLKESVGTPARSNSKVRFSLDESIKNIPRECRTSKELEYHCSFDSDEDNSPENSFSCTQPVSQEAILQGVVAYIEARSNTENRFEGISKQMELLGAVVVKKFIPEVTHVIFKDGKKTTREKAVKKGIHLVNVLWVDSCRQSSKRVPEELFPVVPGELHTPVGKLKRTKSMQPRPFEEEVRKSAERIKRKRQRKVASERTPTSILSPLTIRLLSEDAQAPSSTPLVSSPMSLKPVSDSRIHSESNSPAHQDTDSTVPDLPTKRLCFEESNTDIPDLLPSPYKTPVSPKTIPRDILQTASGPAKKRKRIQSSKDINQSEPDEKPKQTKKNKAASSTPKDIDVFTFDEEDILNVKTSKLKRTRKPKSKSTSGAENKTVSTSHKDAIENDLRANGFAKKDENETNIQRSEKQDTQKKEFRVKKANKAKQGKNPVVKKRKETTKDLRCEEEGKLLNDVCKTTESDREEKTTDKTKPKKENNTSRRKKSVRKKILDDTDDEEKDNVVVVDINNDGGDEEKDNVVVDINDDGGDDDDDDTNSADDVDGDESGNLNDRDCGEDTLTNKSKGNSNIGQKTKEKNLNRTKPSRSLVLTSLHFSEQDIAISVVRKLGGFYIADTVGPNTTHVVSGSPRRTLNVLMAIAQGNWLVSPEWVMKSLETGYWVDEEPYELSDAFPSAQLSRLERVSTGPDYRQELFADVDPIFVCENTSPPRDALVRLITLCGGKVCTSIRKAGVCVGSTSRKTKAINVSEGWILDCVTEHAALSFNSYVFNPSKSTSPTF